MQLKASSSEIRRQGVSGQIRRKRAFRVRRERLSGGDEREFLFQRIFYAFCFTGPHFYPLSFIFLTNKRITHVGPVVRKGKL
jgi:hypothetical protein